MITLSIALLGSTCLILTIFSAVIKDRYSLLGTTLSALTGAFLLIFSMVVMNLSSAINALSLFVMIGLVFYMGSRLIENCKVDNVHVQAAIVDIFRQNPCSRKYLKYPKAFSCRGSSSFKSRMKNEVSSNMECCSPLRIFFTSSYLVKEFLCVNPLKMP